MKRILIVAALLQGFVLFSSDCKDVGGTEMSWEQYLTPQEPQEIPCGVPNEKEVKTYTVSDIEAGQKIDTGSLVKIPCYDNYENFVDTENEFSYSMWLRFSFSNKNEGLEEREEYVCFSPNRFCKGCTNEGVYLFKLDEEDEAFKKYLFWGAVTIFCKNEGLKIETTNDMFWVGFKAKKLTKAKKEYCLESFFYF